MIALRIVRAVGAAWVALYTLGLEAEVRNRRRDEIASDLYEHATTAAGGRPIAGAVAARFVRGVPADIARRIERGMGAAGGEDLVATWHGLGAVVLVLGIAVASLVYAMLHTFGYLGHSRLYAFVQVGMLIGTLVLLRGLSMLRESPRGGGALVLASGLALSFLWMFMPPIAIAMLLVTGYGVVRAWQLARAAHTDRDEREGGGPMPLR
jgi:hypothetical protein